MYFETFFVRFFVQSNRNQFKVILPSICPTLSLISPHCVLNPVIETADSSVDGRSAGSAAVRVTPGRQTDHLVVSVGVQARKRSARISLTTVDSTISKAVVHSIPDVACAHVDLCGRISAFRGFPDGGSDCLQSFVPLVSGRLHGEAPSRDEAKLTFIILVILRQTSRTDNWTVEGNWRRDFHECDVIRCDSISVFRMLN